MLALLDLKKAFDFINHVLLIIKLKHIRNSGVLRPLLWLYCYLSERTHKVKLNNSCSTVQSISFGVPQGSLITPILFNLFFINDVFRFNSNNIEFYLYADDAAIILSADTDNELQIQVGAFFLSILFGVYIIILLLIQLSSIFCILTCQTLLLILMATS